MKNELELSELGHFVGTEQYHKGNFGILLTDGIAYLLNNGYAWVVTDAMVILKMHKKVRNEEFVTIKLKINPDQTAEILYTDGNDNKLYKQKYEYTDAKRELTLFFTNNVLMLAAEY